MPLLERIAPDVVAPVAFRPGGTPPRLEHVTEAELVTRALQAARARGRAGGGRGGVRPHRVGAGLVAAAAALGGIPLLSPRRAKGLEFDHVVVVEPALIAEGETGLRELYVALTRPTRTLVVVYARPFPYALQNTRNRSSRA